MRRDEPAGWRRASPALRLTFRATRMNTLFLPIGGLHFEPRAALINFGNAGLRSPYTSLPTIAA